MRFSRRHLLDTIVLLICVAAVAVEFCVLPGQVGPLGAYGGAVVVAAAVVASRFRPWLSLALVLAATFLDALFWQPLLPWTIAVFLVFSLTRKGTNAIGSGALVAAGVYLAEVYADGVGYINTTAFIAVAFTVTAAATGSALRSRERFRQTELLRAREAAAARESEANRRVVEERLRIARDLHDVVGHEIAVVSMHLGVAEVSMVERPDAARAALDSARLGVQAVLLETQQILGVLRRGSDDDSISEGLRPTPGMAGLPALLESFRAIGLDIRASTTPAHTQPEPAVDAAIYRIVQEALTNAHRHGDGDAQLELSTDGAEVMIRVSNHRPTASMTGSTRRGYGLVGMRERAASAGGTLSVDTIGDTFVIVARLPTDGRTAR